MKVDLNLQNIKSLYILGKPIETSLGKIKFVKVCEYDRFIKYAQYINLEKIAFLKKIAEIDREVARNLKDMPFIDIIKGLRDVSDLYNMYEEMFFFLFQEDVFDQIDTDEEFEYYRDLIRKMNNVPYEKENPNPEIQYFNNLKNMYNKRKSNGDLSFEAIHTSVEAFTGISPDKMTIYKMYAIFNRIGQFKNHEATILYSSVSNEVQVNPWYRHIDLLGEEDKKTTLDEFSKNAKQIIN